MELRFFGVLPAHALQQAGFCGLLRVVRFVIGVIGCIWVVYPLPKRGAELLLVCKRKCEIVCPARVSRQEDRVQTARTQLFLQRRERTHRELVVLGQRGDEAVSAVCAEQIVSPVNK